MRLPILDGYRAISIIFVLCGHLLPLGPKAWRLNEGVAALGMTMFFSLSGFLITSQLLKDQHVGGFLLRRMARIWPLVLAYTAVVYGAVQFSPDKILFTNLFVVNYLHQFLDGWNGHLWSLCVEVQFYACIALGVLVGGRPALWIVWPACLAVTVIRIAAGAEVNILTHLRVDEILVGACVATIGIVHSRRIAPPWLFLSVLAITLASSIPAGEHLQYARPYITGVLLIVAIRQNPDRWLGKILASKLATYIAEISYSLYVIHPAFTHGWFEGIGPLDKYTVKRPIGIALTFALAHLSTFYWERPWTRLVKANARSPSPATSDHYHSMPDRGRA